MSNFSRRLGLALVSAALGLGAPTAHAQDAAVRYWIPGGPFGFGDDLAAGASLDTYGNFPSFDGGDARDGGFPYMRFPKGWFVGSEGGAVGLGMNGLDPDWAFGGIGSLHYEGVQFGYNFKSLGGLPVTFFGGVDNLKYDAGIGGPFASFDSTSGTLPGYYGAHAGVALQATPNVSLSFGVGYTAQQSGRVDSDINSSLLPGASPFALVGH
jgi:hypothetical protein